MTPVYCSFFWFSTRFIYRYAHLSTWCMQGNKFYPDWIHILNLPSLFVGKWLYTMQFCIKILVWIFLPSLLCCWFLSNNDYAWTLETWRIQWMNKPISSIHFYSTLFPSFIGVCFVRAFRCCCRCAAADSETTLKALMYASSKEAGTPLVHMYMMLYVLECPRELLLTSFDPFMCFEFSVRRATTMTTRTMMTA